MPSRDECGAIPLQASRTRTGERARSPPKEYVFSMPRCATPVVRSRHLVCLIMTGTPTHLHHCGKPPQDRGIVHTLRTFLPEVREFIKDTRPKTNTTRGGRKAHRPTPKTRTIHPPSSRTVSSGRVVGGRPQTPARLGVANPPGPISVSDPTRDTDGYPCCPSPQRRRALGCHRTALRLAPAYAG